MEIKDATRCAFMAPDPKLMTVDFNQINKQAAERRAERDAANPPAPEGPAKELQRLRRELFNLTECVKSMETYRDNQADNVKACEQRLTDAIKQKKIAVVNGNERAERNWEHSIKQLECELVDSEREFRRAELQNAQAARALKAFDGHARIAELVSPVVKSTKV